MRILIIMLSAMFLLGCGSRAAFCEHAEEASMQLAPEFTLYIVNTDGQITTLSCRIPQEAGIEQCLAERFLAENEEMLGAVPSVEVRLDGALAWIDIAGMPSLKDAAQEAAFLEAMAETMAQLPAVRQVKYTFDGEALAELPHGTRCFTEFPMDVSE